MPIILGPKEKSTLTNGRLAMIILVCGLTLPLTLLGFKNFVASGPNVAVTTFVVTLTAQLLVMLTAQLAFIFAASQFLRAKDSAKKIAKFCFCMAAISIALSFFAFFLEYNRPVNPQSMLGDVAVFFQGIFLFVFNLQLLPIRGLIPALTAKNPSPLAPSDEELKALWQAKLQEKHVE